MKQRLYQWLAQWKWIVQIKLATDHAELTLYELRMEVMYIWRQIFGLPHADSVRLHFAIVCVKRTVYCELALRQINSLHLHAPNHEVTMYADAICLEYLKAHRDTLHYPDRVHLENISTKKDDPWQFSKVECLIRASQSGQILMDADGIWRSAPNVNRTRIVFLVPAYPFIQNRTEATLVRKVSSIDVSTSFHYVTGFVSIPKRMMTAALADRCRTLTREIFKKSQLISSRDERTRIRRLAEEIALSIAVQEIYPARRITTLKSTDGPNDRTALQSMYYGCAHQIEQ